MSTIYVQTEKPEFKHCPCMHPECENYCRVNKFYAPVKARCPEHGGVEALEIIEDADTSALKVKRGNTRTIATTPDSAEPFIPPFGNEPNYRLGQLMCPVCEDEEPLEILAITEGGHIDFGCQGCEVVVGITFNFRVCQIRSVPEGLAELVKKFNIRQVGTMDTSLAQKIREGRFIHQ